MGARSKRVKQGRHQKRELLGESEGGTVNGVSSLYVVPRCVSQLQSERYDELEEACDDLCRYATQAAHHAGLLSCGVPLRLATLLSKPVFSEGTATNTIEEGALRVHISAAEALRNIITNSTEDEAIDGLIGHLFPDALNGTQQSFAAVLLSSLFRNWRLIEEMRQLVASAPVDLEEDGLEAFEATTESEDSHTESAATCQHTARIYFTLLHLHEELLQLATVSVDGEETIAAAFSTPSAASEILRQFVASTRHTWDYIHHAQGVSEVTATTEEENQRVRFLRREACLLVRLSTAVSELLHTLSSENPELAACFTTLAAEPSCGVTAELKAWLDETVGGEPLLSWFHSSQGTLGDVVLDGTRTYLQLEHDGLIHQLLQATLGAQGMLMSLFPSEENARRVLPLTVAVLSAFLPIRQWRLAIPLLRESCDAAEDLRSAAVRLITCRLRASKAAVEVLSSCVSFVGIHNTEDEDDEVAFRNNPLASLLTETNALYAFGCVLKDALWMCEVPGNVEEEAAMDALRLTEQRALRLAARANSEATTIQYVMLSTEVVILNLASALLVLIHSDSLGDARLIWRSILSAVHSRSELLRLASLANGSVPFDEPGASQEDRMAGAYTLATESPAARHLLWLQITSLLQILWTLQRKQFASFSSFLECPNHLEASANDVDLLIRLAWEKDGPPGLFQACVGTVTRVCASFQNAEAVQVAARFCLSAIQNAGGPQTPLAGLEDGVMSTGAPTVSRDRHRWLARLQRADCAVSARCEAANALMDLFSDERYDSTVYTPLGTQSVLRNFTPSLKQHILARQRISKELYKHYRVEATAADLEIWAEVRDNLEGFLAYKRQNGCS